MFEAQFCFFRTWRVDARHLQKLSDFLLCMVLTLQICFAGLHEINEKVLVVFSLCALGFSDLKPIKLSEDNMLSLLVLNPLTNAYCLKVLSLLHLLKIRYKQIKNDIQV